MTEMQTSEANTAVASDLDLIALFRVSSGEGCLRVRTDSHLIRQDREFPHNIAEAIVQLSPLVEVDESGGMFPCAVQQRLQFTVHRGGGDRICRIRLREESQRQG